MTAAAGLKKFARCIAASGFAGVALLPVPGWAQAPARAPRIPPRSTQAAREGPAIQRLLAAHWSRAELRKLVTAPRTAHDHLHLAKYYRHQARGEQSRAQNDARFARAFGDRQPVAADRHFSAGRMAFYYHASAQSSRARVRADQWLAALYAQAVRKQGCFSCHSFHGRGATIGPDLALEGTRGRSQAWLMRHFQNPQAHVPASVMPAFRQLTQRQLKALARFLLLQK